MPARFERTSTTLATRPEYPRPGPSTRSDLPGPANRAFRFRCRSTPGAAEAQALVAESIAIEGGIPSGKIAEAEGLALHAGAFNGIPDPVFHLTARAMGIVTGLAAVEPDPAAPDQDLVLDIALDAATALAGLLRFRSACVTATTAVEQAHVTAKLVESGALLTRAADAVTNLLELAKLTASRSTNRTPDPSEQPVSHQD